MTRELVNPQSNELPVYYKKKTITSYLIKYSHYEKHMKYAY